MLAGPTTGQGLSSVVTSGGLTLGKKIKALFASSAAHAPPHSCYVGGPPKIASDQRAVSEWNVVTLPNDDASFTMDGVIPIDAVVDMGARRVMISANIADLIGLRAADPETWRVVYHRSWNIGGAKGGDQKSNGVPIGERH